MKILIDMNLSPGWVSAFAAENIESVHWSSVGDSDAEDWVIMDWARANGCIVFTHDLDFGVILALTKAKGPSVIQIRAQNILPNHSAGMLISVLREHQAYLEAGALIVIDENRARVRVLPI